MSAKREDAASPVPAPPVERSRLAPALEWLEERTGVVALLRRHLKEFRVPSTRGHLPLGGILLFALGLQIFTGILLLFHFVPSPQEAFESVRTLMRDVPYGWLVRLMHAHSANLMVVLVFVHLFRNAFRGAYKAPRELVWVTGCLLFVLVLGAALTGYILPWSQLSYWATTVVTASLSYAPFVGDDLVEFVRGGELVGDATYRRAFAAHVGLIPLALVTLVALHLALVRRAGLSGPAFREGHGQEGQESSTLVPLYPTIALRYVTAIVGFLIVLFAFVFFAPNLFFPGDSLVPANPFETPPNVKPEWYFLWAYELPQLIPEALALVLQGVALAGLFALPFVDRSPLRHPLDRPLVTLGLVLGIVALIVLSVLGYLA